MKVLNSHSFSDGLITIMSLNYYLLVNYPKSYKLVYYINYHIYIICTFILKLFLIPAINSNNFLYYNIIIYKHDIFIDIVVLKILI